MKYDFKGLVLLGALIGTAACSDRLSVPNYNKPVIGEVTKDPQAIQLLATGIIQRERSLQPGTSQDFGFFGRESYIYFPTDGRNVTGFLVGVPGFGGKTLDPGGFAATATNWGHTSAKPAPRYRMAAANATKCVDGEIAITVRRNGGMLSSGVLPPDSSIIGIATRMKSRPSCGIERAIVPRKIPIAVAKNR